MRLLIALITGAAISLFTPFMSARPAGAADGGVSYHAPPPAGAPERTTQARWCGDYHLGALTSSQRLAGANLSRLRAAQAELAPGFAPQGMRTGLYLLADYQAELERRRPDVVLAASYLALVGTVPLTPARYRQVNALLCVSTTAAVAAKIRGTAERLRVQEAAPAAAGGAKP